MQTCTIKCRLQFEDYKNFLKASQIESKITHLGEEIYDVDETKQNHE